MSVFQKIRDAIFPRNEESNPHKLRFSFGFVPQNNEPEAETKEPEAQASFTAQPAAGSAAAKENGQPQPQKNVYSFSAGVGAASAVPTPGHVEYVTLIRSRSECVNVIAYIKTNASVFLSMEFISDSEERQRCIDVLCGAAYALGCTMNKISQRGIYLISSPSVKVVVDESMSLSMQQEAQSQQSQPRQAPVVNRFTDYPMGAAAQAYGSSASAGYQPMHYRGTPTERFASPIFRNNGAGFAPQQPEYTRQEGAAWVNVQ